MEKRAFLAVVLSLLIILIFQSYMAKFYPQATSHPSTALETGRSPLDYARGGQATGTESIRTTESGIITPSPSDEKETLIETERFKITFTNIGGAVKKIELKDYPDSRTKEPFELINVKDPQYNIGSLKELDIIPNSCVAAYNLTREPAQVIYYYTTGDFSIEKRYEIHNSLNNIELSIKLKNYTDREIITDYNIIAGSSINSSEPATSRDIDASYKINEKIFHDKRDSIHQGEVHWAALKNKYFSIILKPHQIGNQTTTKRIDNKKLVVEFKTKQFAIPSQGEINHDYFYYIGPNHIPTLQKYGLGLEEVVNYGIFSGISMILLNILRFFYNIFHNWGLSIICVTLLINFILYPLNRKSFQSMKQLQELQPHIEKLRELHKDNPNKLNKEIMELYKKYRVNPFGGCLPILLQMPIIIAMYQAIMRSIELKGSNFLWIKDLSEPDAVRLPFTLPIVGNSINILPILMIIAMIFQQKFSPMSKSTVKTEQQRQQQTMMLIMPVMFGIIFYSLPSGLVLYWLLNTLIMIFNQYKIAKVTSSIKG